MIQWSHLVFVARLPHYPWIRFRLALRFIIISLFCCIWVCDINYLGFAFNPNRSISFTHKININAPVHVHKYFNVNVSDSANCSTLLHIFPFVTKWSQSISIFFFPFGPQIKPKSFHSIDEILICASHFTRGMLHRNRVLVYAVSGEYNWKSLK